MKNNDENLKELFSAMLGEEESSIAETDIRKGDELLDRFKADAPGKEVVAAIKTQVAANLWVRKRRRFVRRTSELAVAAVLIVGVLLSLVLIDDGTVEYNGLVSQSGEWSITSDAEYSLILSEFEEIENRIISIRLDEDEYEVDTLVDIEMEMLELDGSFWKG